MVRQISAETGVALLQSERRPDLDGFNTYALEVLCATPEDACKLVLKDGTVVACNPNPQVIPEPRAKAPLALQPTPIEVVNLDLSPYAIPEVARSRSRSPIREDPFADFEIVERLNGDATDLGREGSYARAGLRTGLELAMDEGWNPYVFGLIASSDSHNASATVEEDNHHGKLPVLDGTAGIRSGEALLLPTSATPGATWGGGGLAAVWAEENTRASIFAALERRETFATSGTRLQVRFFGGWALDPQTLRTGDAVEAGYRDGVPMGGFLPPRPEDATPQFLVWADKDPVGANLDRIQIVKGWVEADGVSRERVHDVAVAGTRAIDAETGLHEPVGNTVDVDEATWTNTIGAAHLSAHWIDPDFSPGQDAFYYVRVLEIPTPRMSTYDAKALGRAAPEPTTIQERAATSAIWFDASGASADRAL